MTEQEYNKKAKEINDKMMDDLEKLNDEYEQSKANYISDDDVLLKLKGIMMLEKEAYSCSDKEIDCLRAFSEVKNKMKHIRKMKTIELKIKKVYEEIGKEVKVDDFENNIYIKYYNQYNFQKECIETAYCVEIYHVNKLYTYEKYNMSKLRKRITENELLYYYSNGLRGVE